jgi:negative regulator of sigma E activity
MPDVEGAWLAREGDATVVTLERDGLRIRVVTDLPLSDVDRLVRSLRPA